MAKLTKLPELWIIDGLKGTLDFYEIRLNPQLSKGIPCCRSWPRFDPEKRTPASANASRYFAYINSMASSLPECVVNAYKNVLQGSSLTWKDMMVRMYLNGDKV